MAVYPVTPVTRIVSRNRAAPAWDTRARPGTFYIAEQLDAAAGAAVGRVAVVARDGHARRVDLAGRDLHARRIQAAPQDVAVDSVDEADVTVGRLEEDQRSVR